MRYRRRDRDGEGVERQRHRGNISLLSLACHTSTISDCFVHQHQTGKSMNNTLRHQTKVVGALPPSSHSWGDTCTCCPTASSILGSLLLNI